MDGPTLHAISRALVYEAEPMGSIKETLSNQLTNGLLQNAAVRAARGLNQRGGAPVAAAAAAPELLFHQLQFSCIRGNHGL